MQMYGTIYRELKNHEARFADAFQRKKTSEIRQLPQNTRNELTRSRHDNSRNLELGQRVKGGTMCQDLPDFFILEPCKGIC